MIVDELKDEPVIEDVKEDEDHEDDAEDSDEEDDDKEDGSPGPFSWKPNSFRNYVHLTIIYPLQAFFIGDMGLIKG